MSIPGKCALFLLAFLPLTAAVKVSVDENPVIAGESVEIILEAEGEDVRFPNISAIGEYNVTTEGMQRLERLEENRTVVRWIKLFAFTPQKSVTIPAMEVTVDGQTERTKPLFLQVKPKSQRSADDFNITLAADRTEAYVGQMVDVTVRFKEKRGVPVMNVDFVPIRYENFWVKRVGKERRFAEGEYLVHEIHYLFFPQTAGELTIGPAHVKVAVTKKVRDAFGFIVRRPQWITLSSRPLRLHVKPLPENVELVGDFRLRADASPHIVEKGKPVTLTVHVDAEGNIEDFNLPPLRIDGVTVYGEKPLIRQRYNHGVYRGSWEKRYVLVAESSFTIPSFRVLYFDPEKDSVETAASEPIAIEVKGEEPEKRASEAFHSVSKPAEEMDMIWIYWNLAAAFLLGMGVMYLLMRWTKRRGRRADISLPPAGDHSRMLQQLMPHISESKEAAQMAENLYAAIFEGRSVKIDKKEFRELMEKLKASGRDM